MQPRTLADIGRPDLSEAMDILIGDIKERIVSIDESEFVSKWLPILTSKMKPDLTGWIELAGGGFQGGQFKSVNVTKNGKLLFVVPPLYAKAKTQVKYSEEQSIGQMVDMIDVKSKRLNRSKDDLIPLFLTPLLSHATADPVADAQWVEILKRYGFKAAPAIGVKTPTPQGLITDDESFEAF